MQHNKLPAGRPTRASIFALVEEAVGELRARFGGLPAPQAAEEIWSEIWLHEAHHSTAIEGNTLVLDQVAMLLSQGHAVGNKEFREYLEVSGYATAARWVYEHAVQGQVEHRDELITLTELRQIHQLALGPVWEVSPPLSSIDQERPGNFRRHEIATFPGGMKPPSWVEVPAEIAEWVKGVQQLPTSVNPMEDLARCHAELERIHPFLDGNGRVGRLVTNLLLIRLGYPPLIILKSQRAKYLRALRSADRGSFGPLAELFARAVLDSIYRFTVPSTQGEDALVPLTALARAEFNVNSMKAAIARGRMRAQKGSDGKWRSTKAWVDAYRSSKYSARPRT